MSLCDTIRDALSGFDVCEDTNDGARVPTHCLYPSFELVHAYVVKRGDGYVVHDGGEAASCAWAHGRDEPTVAKALKASAHQYGCKLLGARLEVEVIDARWLASAILSVSNAASSAASAAVGKSAQSTQAKLAIRLEEVLRAAPWKPRFKREFSVSGTSGKVHTFDFGVHTNGSLALVDIVVPHHASVSAKYVAFADTERSKEITKFAVFERELDRSDKVLLSTVADLIPYRQFEETHGEIIRR